MKLKNTFFYTLRENVKDEDSNSGNYLVRSGMIKKTSAGVYMYLPMGLKVFNKIQEIVREEMNNAGALEVSMPALISEDVYVASGRRANFGSSMFSLKDRFGKPFVLGPTHEELFAMAAQMKIRSYKDMPFNIYQFQTKFRDEPRPRFGLIRVREFVMKDAYTFDTNLDGLNVSYQKMFDAYKKSFDRMKMDYKIVRADTGVMGGLLSEEFQAVTPIGEDTLVLCDHCDFSSNIEVSECIAPVKDENVTEFDKELVETPHSRTIEEVTEFMGESADKFVKTLIYSIDSKPYAVMVRGDRDVNEVKIQKLMHANEVVLADADTVVQVTGAAVGFAGPIDIKCPVLMDNEVAAMHNFIIGANKTGYHYKNVNLKDFTVEKTADIRNIQEGDICPKCGGRIHFAKGIEVGNTFKLGTKYSDALNLKYLDTKNQLQPVWMGSYGIGIGRCMAAIAEQYCDENGLKWPVAVAPYEVAIVLISGKDEVQTTLSEKLYKEMKAAGIDVLLDDRDERPGVKFKDMDLIGVPYRLTVGKKASENIVEFKSRDGQISMDLNADDALKTLKDLINQAKAH
ncbi:MAG: proline--tRNA ligase [Erysipelotrichaceae bacterium]|nr:proline--tRNA ligase [Erysipelotrichaceae bacterium]